MIRTDAWRGPLGRVRVQAGMGRSAGSDDCTALFLRWRHDGDQRARDALVERFLPLARKLAMRYLRANEPADDLVQVASVGLVKAINRFEPERGLSFVAFASPTITGELKRYFRDFGWALHVPRSAQERAVRVEMATRDLTGAAGRTPSIHQLAQYLEWDLGDVLDAFETANAHHATSLDAPSHDRSAQGSSIIDLFGDIDERYDLVEERLSVAAVLPMLPLIERRVVYLRFIEDLTQAQIADLIGVSQMQVSRLLRSALARLRDLVGPA